MSRCGEDAEDDDGRHHQEDEREGTPDDVLEADIGGDLVDDEDVESDGGWISPFSITTDMTTPNQNEARTPPAQRRQDDRRVTG